MTANARGLVLIVEDDPVNIEIARRFLESRGLSSVHARDGAAAVDACERDSYAVVLMDWHLPGIDGLEATRQIRAREVAAGRSHVPIVAMTATVFDGAREACLAAGMDDFLEKPISLAAIDAVIARWVRKDEPTCASVPVDPERTATLDRAVLTELFMLGGIEVVQEVVDLFGERGPLRAAEAAEAAQRGDAPALASSLHSLRGMASQLGVTFLAQEAREIEDGARRGEIQVARVAHLATDVAAAVMGLRELLEAVAAAPADGQG